MLQLPTGQIKVQPSRLNSFLPSQLVATPHGSDKSATLKKYRASTFALQLPTGQIKVQREYLNINKYYSNFVATPHGSDKSATPWQERWYQYMGESVATPHGSDKSATKIRYDKFRDMIYVYELQLLTGQIKVQHFFKPQFFSPFACQMLQLPMGQIKVQP